MKIYFDGIIYSWQSGGGIYRYFCKIINGLSKNNEIKIIKNKPCYNFIFNDVKIISPIKIHFFKNNLLLRRLLSPVNKFFINNYFKRIKKGVFCSTYYTTYNSLNIPQILVVHDLTYERFPQFFNSAGSKRFIANKKKCINKADSIICVSETTKEYLKKIYDVPLEKINVIYHGVSPEFNTEYTEYDVLKIKNKYNLTNPFLLFVGQRRGYKNFNFLLEVFSQWSVSNNFDLVIVGGGAPIKEEILLIEKFKNNCKIKFVGSIIDEELKIFYCITDGFVFPSLDEGFGLPNLEALCCGAPIIVSDIPVFREILGDLAIYFNPSEKEDLMAAFDFLVINKEENKQKILANIKNIRNKFSWDNCIKETQKVFEKFL